MPQCVVNARTVCACARCLNSANSSLIPRVVEDAVCARGERAAIDGRRRVVCPYAGCVSCILAIAR
eukprot:8083994-Lingulodinium_polyedra.AAC.1